MAKVVVKAAAGGGSIALAGPASSGSDVELILPSADATASGQALTSNASGTLSFASVGATGGGTDKVFHLNDLTIDSNYTLANDQNAMTAGPVTIADGVTVTLGTSTWTIV